MMWGFRGLSADSVPTVTINILWKEGCFFCKRAECAQNLRILGYITCGYLSGMGARAAKVIRQRVYNSSLAKKLLET